MTRPQVTKAMLYEQVARIAKATASPKRLEILELLSQAPKSVETLARETGISDKLASAHLRTLRSAQLVATERQGKHIYYRLASPAITELLAALGKVAEDRLEELQMTLHKLMKNTGVWRAESHRELLRKAESGEIIILDVRPAEEYEHAHIPFARSYPLTELKKRLHSLPRDKAIVVYCRGPFCLMSPEAVQLLKKHGFKAVQLRDGVSDFLKHAPKQIR